MHEGYWPSHWPAEDGGRRRLQVPLGPWTCPTGALQATSRDAIAATMLVLRDHDEVFLLRHTGGSGAVAWVERIDPITLEPLGRCADLPGGLVWPGGLAAHADGSLYVVFGRWAHRLSAELEVLAATELPRDRPYNSFAVLPDGHLVTKDFGGALPPAAGSAPPSTSTEVVVLAPGTLDIVARTTLPEPSIARVSADDGGRIAVVGTTSVWTLRWDGARLALDDASPRYVLMDGQTYGWDPVLALGATWFLDNGEGSERYAGSFAGIGTAGAPLHLVRVDDRTGAVTLTDVCGLPKGLIANPPLVDEHRRMAVAYDSANGALCGLSIVDDGSPVLVWRRSQHHAAHLLLEPVSGTLVTNDHDAERFVDQVVLLDVATGAERGRVDTASPVQSVLFPAPGWNDDLYLCSFTHVTRVAAR